jgi:hypothetical protein
MSSQYQSPEWLKGSSFEEEAVIAIFLNPISEDYSSGLGVEPPFLFDPLS